MITKIENRSGKDDSAYESMMVKEGTRERTVCVLLMKNKEVLKTILRLVGLGEQTTSRHLTRPLRKRR